jgi:hypothetical protein
MYKNRYHQAQVKRVLRGVNYYNFSLMKRQKLNNNVYSLKILEFIIGVIILFIFLSRK